MSKVIEAAKDIVDSVIDAAEFVAGTIKQAAQDSWNYIAMPILEEVFSWFGVVDEYTLNAKKVSAKLFDDGADVYKTALIRTVLSNSKNDATFYQNYMYEVNRNKAQIGIMYRQIRAGRHTHGLPQMTISGGNVDDVAIAAVLDTVIGVPTTVIETNSYIPSTAQYFQNSLQASPEFYKPYSNSLTHDNQYGQSFDDWSFIVAEFNDISNDYDVTVSRLAEQAVFWIEGNNKVVEGDPIEYKVLCNREVPAGETATLTLSYGGTAVGGVDYTAVATVDILGGTQETVFYITTIENASAESNRTLEVAVTGMDNTLQLFEAVLITPIEDSVTTTIVDDDSLILTMSNVRVSESATSVTIPVKLEAATTAFTVDFALSNITALKGVDYEDISGTLSFAGTAGEVQNIVIGITADLVDDDYEQFLVSLENSSNLSVDISQTSTVTIVDSTDNKYPPSNVTDVVVFSKPDYVIEKTLMVKYHETSEPESEWYMWHYPYSLGTYPQLNETADRMSNLDMLPTIALRNDKVNVNNNKTSKEYKSTKRLLNFMGMKLDDLMDSITSNPDIGAVDDAFIYFGISPLDESPAISKMLYVMWEEIIVKYGIYSNTGKYHASYNVGEMVKNSVVWTSHSILDVPSMGGISPDVGEYNHGIVGTALFVRYGLNSATTRVIRVDNLSSLSMVSAIIDGERYDKAVPNVMSDEDFTIPVSWFVLNKLSPKEALQVFPYMTRIEFYAATLVEIAWYKTDGFKIALRIIQVVLTIFFWYIGGGTWAELAYELIVGYAIGEFIALGIDAILKMTGNKDIALAVGLIAAIAFSANGSFNIDFTDPVKLLEISTMFANNVARVYMAVNKDLVSEMQEYDEAFEERQEEIDAANRLLDTGVNAEYMAHLNSVDTNIDMAITAQYNFSYIYNYDSLVENFCDDKLKVGII